jgi:chromosome segregation protein
MPREKPGGDVEASETRQSLDWLEQERRRDKALLAELQARMDEREGELAHTRETVEALSQELDRVSKESKSTGVYAKALQQFKDEVMLELRKYEEHVAKEAQQADSHLLEERKERQGSLIRLEQRIEEVSRLQERLRAQQADIDRLTKTTSAFGMQAEAAAKDKREQQEHLLGLEGRIARGEERTADLFQAQEAMNSRSDDILESLRLAQAQMERLSRQVSDLESWSEELKGERAALVEELRAVDDRGKKQIAAWTKEMGKWREEAEALRAQLALSDKQVRKGDAMLTDLDALRIQLEKDREALQHLERTAEERQRQQLEEWRQENRLLWSRNDERWDQLAEENSKRDDHIAALWNSQLAHLRREVGELEKWMKEVEKRLMRPNR